MPARLDRRLRNLRLGTTTATRTPKPTCTYASPRSRSESTSSTKVALRRCEASSRAPGPVAWSRCHVGLRHRQCHHLVVDAAEALSERRRARAKRNVRERREPTLRARVPPAGRTHRGTCALPQGRRLAPTGGALSSASPAEERRLPRASASRTEAGGARRWPETPIGSVSSPSSYISKRCGVVRTSIPSRCCPNAIRSPVDGTSRWRS